MIGATRSPFRESALPALPPGARRGGPAAPGLALATLLPLLPLRAGSPRCRSSRRPGAVRTAAHRVTGRPPGELDRVRRRLPGDDSELHGRSTTVARPASGAASAATASPPGDRAGRASARPAGQGVLARAGRPAAGPADRRSSTGNSTTTWSWSGGRAPARISSIRPSAAATSRAEELDTAFTGVVLASSRVSNSSGGRRPGERSGARSWPTRSAPPARAAWRPRCSARRWSCSSWAGPAVLHPGLWSTRSCRPSSTGSWRSSASACWSSSGPRR